MNLSKDGVSRQNEAQRRQTGFTLLEIMIVVSIIALLLAIIIPSSVQARTRSQKHVCISHLRQISSAIQQWALETKQSPAANVTENDVTPYIKTSVHCPAGGKTFDDSYEVSKVSIDPTCKKSPATHFME